MYGFPPGYSFRFRDLLPEWMRPPEDWPPRPHWPAWRWVVLVMALTQMIAWAWMMHNGGSMESDVKYTAFSIMMMIGQAGTGYECKRQKSWSTLLVQIYFFIVTAYGLYQRLYGA